MRKILGILLMLALVVMPVRIAFAGNHPPAGMDHGKVGQSHTSPQAHHNLAMPHMSPGVAPDMSSATQCDTPDHTACDKQASTSTTHHCSSDAHCCIVLVESLYDTTHPAPYMARSTLSITLTSIIIPTATKPPRHTLSA